MSQTKPAPRDVKSLREIAHYTIPSAPNGSEILLHEGTGNHAARIWLAFSPQFARFVALKQYPTGSSPVEDVQKRVQHIQAHFHDAISYPLEAWEHENRLYHATELPPGYRLSQLVEDNLFSARADILHLALLIFHTLRHVREDFGLTPSLHPSRICLGRAPDGEWRVRFADYDLRPDQAADERGLTEELSLLYYFMGTGTLSATFQERLGISYTPLDYPNTHVQMVQLFRRFFDPDPERRPGSLAQLEEVLNLYVPELELEKELSIVPAPVRRAFLAWMPAADEVLAARFQSIQRSDNVDQPCTFAAQDRLRGIPATVHLLPPEGSAPADLNAEYEQCLRAAQGKGHRLLTTLETVMSDPRGRLIAERPAATVSLATILEGETGISPAGAVALLTKIDAALVELEREGFPRVSLSPHDLQLRPGNAAAWTDTWEPEDFERLEDAARFEIVFRPFQSNPFYVETKGLAPLAERLADSPGALTNLWRPGYEFVLLAWSIVSSRGQVEPFLESISQALRGAPLSQAASRRGFLRQMKLALSEVPTVAVPLVTFPRRREEEPLRHWGRWMIGLSTGLAAVFFVIAMDSFFGWTQPKRISLAPEVEVFFEVPAPAPLRPLEPAPGAQVPIDFDWVDRSVPATGDAPKIAAAPAAPIDYEWTGPEALPLPPPMPAEKVVTIDPTIGMGESFDPGKVRAQQIAEFLKSAALARAQNNPDVAAGAILAVFQLDPENKDAWKEADTLIGGASTSDSGKAFDQLLQTAAVRHHPHALALLAARGKLGSDPLALEWNRRAAGTGDLASMVRLGKHFSGRPGVEADLTEARKWFEQAAGKEDHAEASYLLAECLFFGKGGEKDIPRAIALLKKSHGLGFAPATTMLATCYAKGMGVSEDPRQARKLYQEAIEDGSPEAFGNLGVLYLKGEGGEANAEKAIKLFLQGAQAQDPNAAFYYAKCMEEGIGMEANPGQAREWYVKAAARRHPGAIKWCDQHVPQWKQQAATMPARGTFQLMP